MLPYIHHNKHHRTILPEKLNTNNQGKQQLTFGANSKPQSRNPQFSTPRRKGITEAARRMGITRKTLSEFVNERSSCTPQMALRIAEITNTSAESWLAMQIKLDLWKIRQKTAIKYTRKALLVSSR